MNKPIDRLLHFALLAPGSPQIALRKSLRRVAGEYREFDWYSLWNAGRIAELQGNFVKMAREFQPTLVFMQVQTAGILNGHVLDQVTGKKVSWCGDCRDTTPAWAIALAPHTDLMCFSNARDVENVKRAGFPSAFINIGFSDQVFNPHGPRREGTPEIIFLGNNYGTRFPRSVQRCKMVALLRERYGARFAVHGNGWGEEDIWLDEMTEAAAYRACRIAVGQNHYDDVPRFSSDRIFRSMGSGAFCIHNDFPGVEKDYQIGKEIVLWRDFEGLLKHIDYYLEHEDERKEIARAGCLRTHLDHTWDGRIEELLRVLSPTNGLEN